MFLAHSNLLYNVDKYANETAICMYIFKDIRHEILKLMEKIFIFNCSIFIHIRRSEIDMLLLWRAAGKIAKKRAKN